MRTIAALLLCMPWTLAAADFSCAVISGTAESVTLQVDARELDKKWILTSTTCTVRFTRRDRTTNEEALSGPSGVQGGNVVTAPAAFQTTNAILAAVVAPCYGKKVPVSTQALEIVPKENNAEGTPGGGTITIK